MSTTTHPPSHTRIRLPFRPRKALLHVEPSSPRPGVLLLPWGDLPRGALVRCVQALPLGIPSYSVEHAKGGLTGVSHWERVTALGEPGPLVTYLAVEAEYRALRELSPIERENILCGSARMIHLPSGCRGIVKNEGGVVSLVAVQNRIHTSGEHALLEAYAAADRSPSI